MLPIVFREKFVMVTTMQNIILAHDDRARIVLHDGERSTRNTLQQRAYMHTNMHFGWMGGPHAEVKVYLQVNFYLGLQTLKTTSPVAQGRLFDLPQASELASIPIIVTK